MRDDRPGGGNGHAQEEPGAVVDAAVEAIRRRDREAGDWAQVAADFLTAGEGPGMISQHRLQESLWSALPRKWEEETWGPMVEGAASLLEALGLERYAAIARSSTTRELLEAWREDDDALDRFLAAMDRSGVLPPRTELLEWSDFMGSEEFAAYEAVADALEAAIIRGELRPGASGWRKAADAVTRRTLLEQVRPVFSIDRSPRRRLDLVRGSRIDAWVTGARVEAHRVVRRRTAERFTDGPVAVAPDPPPTDALARSMQPLTWLLDVCREGVRATATGAFEPALVRAAAARFGWWPFEDRPPRAERDIFPLVLLREMATRNHWLQRRSGRFRTTRPGLALLDDPVRLWWAVVPTLGRADQFSAMVGELVIHHLLGGPAEHIAIDRPSELAEAVAPILLQQGWSSGGRPLDIRGVDAALHEPLREWRILGLLEREWWELGTPRPPGRPTVALSETGQVAAVAHLYARATEARRSIFD